MKKILFVINTLGLAGAEKSLIEVLKRIDLNNYCVDLYVLLEQGELIREVPDGINVLNRDFSACPIHSKKGYKELSRRVLKALIRKGTWFRCFTYIVKNYIQMLKKGCVHIDKLLWKAIAMSADSNPNTYDLAIAYVEGGSTYYVSRNVKAKRKAAWIHISYPDAGYCAELDEDAYEEIDNIIVVSDEVKKSVVSIYPGYEDKILQIENIIDCEKIEELSVKGEGFLDNYDGIRILSVGRLDKQKAYELSIEAMRYIMDKKIKARWYVLGEGRERDSLLKLIKKFNIEEDFVLYGNVENPYPYMKQADIYVHASEYEGKSIAVQEAMTLGKPVIVSDCNGNRELVTDGINGLICHLNPSEISDSIIKLINDDVLAKKIGIEASETIKSITNETHISELFLKMI